MSTAHWAVILLGFSKKFFRHKEKFFNRAFSWEVDCCSGSLKSSLKMRKPRPTVYQKEVSILFKSLIHHLNLNISCQVISQVKYVGQSHRPPMHRSHLMSIFGSALTRFETLWKFKHLYFWPTATFWVKSIINLLFPPLSSRGCMQATLVTVVTRILQKMTEFLTNNFS